MKYDFDPELEQLLKSMKNNPAFGGDFDSEKSWKQVASFCGFPEDVSEIKHTWRDWLEFYIWQFTHVVAKPLAVGSVSFAILIIGFVSSVNASMSSLPGERFYSFKTSIEKVQLAIASSNEQRAKLHVEFTNRRLEEMIELAASTKQTDIAEFPLAVDRLKKEVADIQTELTLDKGTELALAVGRKADQYANTVSSTPKLSAEAEKKVNEVKQILNETKEQAVDVMITSHEQTLTSESSHELELTFEKEYSRVSALSQTKDAKDLNIAKKLQEQGLYRRAFQMLKEIELRNTPQE